MRSGYAVYRAFFPASRSGSSRLRRRHEAARFGIGLDMPRLSARTIVSVLPRWHSSSPANTHPRREVSNARRHNDVLLLPPSVLLLLLSAPDDQHFSWTTTPQRPHLSDTTTSVCMRTIRCVARCGPPPARVEAHADALNVEVDAAGADVSAPPTRCAGKGVNHAAASTAAATAHLSSSLMALPPRIPPDAPPEPESERHNASLLLARREGRGLARRRDPRSRAMRARRAACAYGLRAGARCAARLGSRWPPDFTSRRVRRVCISYMSEFSRLDLHLLICALRVYI
jgi:hypothetical protein